jgi:hypothetical protein
MKRMMAAALAAALAAGASDVLCDEPQYRPDQSPVMNGAAERAAQKAQSEGRIVAAFRAAYLRMNKPSFLMLWHRELSDNIDSGREVTAAVSSSGERARDNFDRTVSVRWKNGSEHPVSLLPPARSAEFESGFHQTLRGAGAVLVDRNTAIRMTALGKVKTGARESDLNFQTVEASALAGYAKYFIEARFVPDGEAKGGTEPRITVIDSSSGEILADVVPSALYKQGAGKWMATGAGFAKVAEESGQTEWKADEKGFVKQEKKRSGLEEGRLVALAIMQALADIWESAR